MYVLLVLKFSSIVILASTAIGSLGIGLLYKRILVAKQRKRIIYLEDEMLSNHARILSLERKLADSKIDANTNSHELVNEKKLKLKIS